MFGFMDMMGTYESRKVDNTEVENAIIDTVLVTDSTQPYETAICCPLYNSGKWIIVEQYDTEDDAQAGHDRWVQTFRNGFPDSLKDVSTCELAEIISSLDSSPKIYQKSI